MKRRFGDVQSRRRLLAGTLRYAALGLLGAAGGAAFVKRHRLIREGKCTNRGICRGCRSYEKCSLPQALSAKQVLAGVEHGGR